jgi:chromosome segregation ATPase
MKTTIEKNELLISEQKNKIFNLNQENNKLKNTLQITVKENGELANHIKKLEKENENFQIENTKLKNENSNLNDQNLQNYKKLEEDILKITPNNIEDKELVGKLNAFRNESQLYVVNLKNRVDELEKENNELKKNGIKNLDKKKEILDKNNDNDFISKMHHEQIDLLEKEKTEIENKLELISREKEENEIELNKQIYDLKELNKQLIKDKEIEKNKIHNLNEKILKLEKNQIKKDDNYKIEKKLQISGLNNSLIIDNNIEYNKLIKSWINPNANVVGELLYRLSRDGDKISTFHELCDNKGPILTLFETLDGNKGGIYTPLSWDSKSSYMI